MKPFSIILLIFTRHSKYKRTILGDFCIAGRTITTSVLHLTSDHQQEKDVGLDVKKRRRDQMQSIYHVLNANADDVQSSLLRL